MFLSNLFKDLVVVSDETIALREDSRAYSSANGIHFPMSVVVIDDMEETSSAMWYPLH